MHKAAVETLRDFAELISLGAFLTMIALAARAFGSLADGLMLRNRARPRSSGRGHGIADSCFFSRLSALTL